MPYLSSMKPFPLLPTIGTFPPEHIVGRKEDIIKLVHLLRAQSVSIEEMRRMGKTLLVKKLEYLCNTDQLPGDFGKDQFRAKYFSFQGKKNLGEVIDAILIGLKEFKTWYHIDFKRTYDFIRGLMATPKVEVGGASFTVNLPEYQRSWKKIFFQALEEIASAQEKASSTLILIFDELPIMLWEWYKENKHEDAIELLDILRERRQELEKQGIRFVYCGSIGIKVVLNRFKTELKYTGEPTNDMLEISLKPFNQEDADFLCECFFLADFKVNPTEKQQCVALIFQLSDGLPFYISQLFLLLMQEFNREVTENTIKAAFNILLNDSKHHNAFQQLVDRLHIYYSEQQCQDMTVILNFLAQQDDFISEGDIHQAVSIDNKGHLNECLYTLLSDHYLERKTDSGRMYRFRYPIFKTWWKINKT